MNNNFDTVRWAAEFALAHADNALVNAKILDAISALAAIEADHFTAADMASAAAQGHRDGVASVQQGEPVGTFWQHPKTKEWYQQHDGEPLYRAAPVAQPQSITPAELAKRIECGEKWRLDPEPQAEASPMSQPNRLIAYSAAAKLRELGYQWDEKAEVWAPQQPQAEHDLKDTRCGYCGYMTYEREHMNCIRPAEPQAEAVPDEVQRVLNRLDSFDIGFDDCADAAALIIKMAHELKGPDGFATWKEAAIAERMRRLETAHQQAEAVRDAMVEAAYDAVADALRDAYDCTRDWSAWSYGTMGPDDFVILSEDSDRVREIAGAAIDAAIAQGAKT